ncbi:PleD family two-component system response regulator [Maricaulis sp. CAU 1757]
MSARILVVDDQPANVRLLEARLQAEYFDVVTAADGYAAIDTAKSEQPDLILLDVMMPGIDGYEVCSRLKADPATRHIPVIMVTALDQREDRIRGLEAGADDFLTKPIHDVTMFARLRSLLRLKSLLDELRYREENAALAGGTPEAAQEDEYAGRIVLISPDERALKRYQDFLPGQHQVIAECDPARALEAARDDADLLIIDLTHPDLDGLRLCARVRSDVETRQLPILAIASPDDVPNAVRALDLGANDIIHRPVDAGELAARTRTQMRRKRYADRLRAHLDRSLEMAVTDPLTGLHNRRFISSRLRQALEGYRTGGKPVSLLIADIDHFKRINDTYGHEAGDAILRDFSVRLHKTVRALDLAARYGGEEFLVVMPGAGVNHAFLAADRIRAAICNTPFELADGTQIDVTVSIGLAQAAQGESMEALVKRADMALYEAKDAGRNQVQAATSAAA